MKVYYDRILSGEKVREYRSVTPYYSWLESPELTAIKFHYQGGCHIIVSVKKVNRIPCPERLKSHVKIKFTDEVYEIELGQLLTF